MNQRVPTKENLARIRTRASLLERLKNAEDDIGWREFFDTYWGLIYRFAVGKGLTDDEAIEASQETIIAVARKIGAFSYDPKKGRFGSWLFAITNNRVRKAYDKRKRANLASSQNGSGGDDSVSLDEFPDPATEHPDRLWEEEWERNTLAVATERAKRRVSAMDYQRFDYSEIQGHTPEETAEHLGCAVNTVYSAKHRVVAAIKEELERLRDSSLQFQEPLASPNMLRS